MITRFRMLSAKSLCLVILLCFFGPAVSAAESAKTRIDLNKATQAELETLPGVGPSTAQNIIAARPFKSVQELKEVSGIGEARFNDVQKLVTISSSSSRSTTAKSAATTPDQRKTASSAESSSKPKAAPPATASTSSSRSARVDLNTADAATLETLPGVGPSTAQNIIAARPLKSVADLKEVSGIGEARFQEIQPLVTVSTRASRPASGSPAAATTGRSPSSSTERGPAPERTTAQKATPPKGKINLNTATQAELESLLGIGPAKAQAIIESRPYKSIDEVMQVKGIKDGTFEKIQDKITVR